MTQKQTPTPFLPPLDFGRSLAGNWRERFASPLLIVFVILGVIMLTPAIIPLGNSIVSTVVITAFVVAGVIAFMPVPYNIRLGISLLLVYMFGIGELITLGVLGASLFFFLGMIIFATMMFSPRAGIVSVLCILATLLVFGWFMRSNDIKPINPPSMSSAFQDWLSAGVAIIVFGAVIILGFQGLDRQMLEARNQIDSSRNQLTIERDSLERKVQERTGHLRKVNEIGRIITSNLNPQDMLASAVFLIGNEFDCYFTAVYLVDASGQWGELREASGDAGKVLRENKHRIDLNGKSAIAAAIRAKKTHLAQDHGSEPLRFDNPLLPYTRSQVVIPLMVGDKVIGALEMHSTREAAFSQQDLETFSNLASQLAIAAENSRVFSENQQNLSELRAVQRQYLEGAWSTLMSEKFLEYELGDDDSGEREIQIPLTLRDQIIGQISLTSNEEWTVEQNNLITSIASQAALALDNARLVEESQSIAVREKLASEIISKVWSSTNIDTILQTTVRELGRALDASEVDIELRMAETNE